MTYAANKFYHLLLYARKLKPGGKIFFSIAGDLEIRGILNPGYDKNPRFTKVGGLDLGQFLTEIKLPGFKNKYGSYELTIEEGTIAMLENLNDRLVKAQIGSKDTYYLPPPGHILWLEGVYVKPLNSGSYSKNRAELRDVSSFRCQSVYAPYKLN